MRNSRSNCSRYIAVVAGLARLSQQLRCRQRESGLPGTAAVPGCTAAVAVHALLSDGLVVFG